MARNSSGGISLVIVAILALAIGWFAHQYFGADVAKLLQSSTATTTAETNGSTKDDTGTLCAQVVTSARNPTTGDIKVFPTPCDVPKGWEVIQNDTPGL